MTGKNLAHDVNELYPQLLATPCKRQEFALELLTQNHHVQENV